MCTFLGLKSWVKILEVIIMLIVPKRKVLYKEQSFDFLLIEDIFLITFGRVYQNYVTFIDSHFEVTFDLRLRNWLIRLRILTFSDLKNFLEILKLKYFLFITWDIIFGKSSYKSTLWTVKAPKSLSWSSCWSLIKIRRFGHFTYITPVLKFNFNCYD